MSPADSQAPVKEGDVLVAKYRVEKVLGVGGMGVVVAAHHLDLDQRVALKFLLPRAAENTELVGRFLREARASVRLKGAHVAKTLDVGRLEDGAPYIVMEFLEGNDLDAELKKSSEPLAIEDAASYVVQAALGIAEAHSLGIIHRDLKPGNLFLTRGVDGKPLVKVLDFGISKTLDSSPGGEGLSLTKTEMLLGSPLYMSPEQMRSSKHVDERSDVWALGAIAYELLTRKVPFEADSILALCFKVAQEEPVHPCVHRPELPEALGAAVLRCLEKDIEKRFANVGEVAAALEPFALPRDLGSAQRARDVLGTSRRPRAPSISDALVAEAGVITANSATGKTSDSAILSDRDTVRAPEIAVASSAAGISSVPVVESSNSSGSSGVAPAAWGNTQANGPPAARMGLARGRGALVALGAVVVLVGAGVVASSRRTPAANTGGASALSAEVNADAKAKAEAETKAKAKADADAKAKADADAKAEAEAKASLGKEADAGARPVKVATKGTAAAGSKVPAPSVPVPSATAKATATAPAASPTPAGDYIKVRE